MDIVKRSARSFLLSAGLLLLAVCLLTLSSNGVSYALNHSSNITSNETWYAADNPHIVTTTIHVYSGATLTIEKGCEVRFDSMAGLYIGYFSAATLNAVGTEDAPITFTSNTGSPAPNDWRGIVFWNSTVDGSTIMDYCTVEYGGYDSHHSNIDCDSASPTIQNCTIRYSDEYGIYCDNNSAPTLTNNTLSNNGVYPISLYCGILDSNISGNTGSGNGTDAIEVRDGSITSNRTWVLQDLYFNVTGIIHVYSGAILTINPGSLVKFNSTAALFIGYYSAATLIANGTSGIPITFTSNESTPAPGDWRGIVFFNSTVDGSTILDYCTIEYGGYEDTYNSNINCDNASPTIQNCTIRHSDGYGIYCDNNSAPTLTNNTLSNNGSYPISLYCGILDTHVTGNTGSGNGTDAIEVRDGSITSNRTWVPQDLYFNVTGGVIHVYSDGILTINPGCLVKFNSIGGLSIGYYSAGTLIANGTSGSPITFTSNESTPAPGDWRGIVFWNSTVDGSTIMDYCAVEYGGYGSHNSNINCDQASPTIQNCTVRHSDGYGIYCDNNAAPTLTNNTINDNGSYPISEYCNMLDSNVTGNTGSGNGTDAIQVRSGNITLSHTWVPQDLYFNVTGGGTHVYSDAILTINPGCLVKFDAGTGIYFGYYGAAALIADGTSGNPITFTSNESTPSPADWEGIVFYNSTDDSATIMDYCTVEYGGYGSHNSNINCNQASPTIQHCKIRNSDGHGIYTTGSGALPLISCSRITNNVNGVYAMSNSIPTIADCSISGNTSYGVYNNSSSVTLDAENNWWGSADGPGGVGPGSGDAVSANVDFTPWLSSFDSCLESIVLSPASDTNFVGSLHTVTATVEDEAGDPIEGVVVFFYITSGPHAGLNGNDTTDSNGQATFTYTGTTDGTDTIEATFVDFHGRTITSHAVTKTWEYPATPIPTPSPTPEITPTPSPSPEPSPTPEITPSPIPTPTGTPTAITLAYFHAKAGKDGSVTLTWETVTEVDNAGFNLCRSKSKDGHYTKVNNTTIPAQGNAVSGASYSYVDEPGIGTFYYKLEDVDYYGVSTLHGPEKVRVKSGSNAVRRR